MHHSAQQFRNKHSAYFPLGVAASSRAEQGLRFPVGSGQVGFATQRRVCYSGASPFHRHSCPRPLRVIYALLLRPTPCNNKVFRNRRHTRLTLTYRNFPHRYLLMADRRDALASDSRCDIISSAGDGCCQLKPIPARWRDFDPANAISTTSARSAKTKSPQSVKILFSRLSSNPALL